MSSFAGTAEVTSFGMLLRQFPRSDLDHQGSARRCNSPVFRMATVVVAARARESWQATCTTSHASGRDTGRDMLHGLRRLPDEY